MIRCTLNSCIIIILHKPKNLIKDLMHFEFLHHHCPTQRKQIDALRKVGSMCLPTRLGNWELGSMCPSICLSICPGNWELGAGRLDASFTWLPRAGAGLSDVPLVYLDEPCAGAAPASLDGKWAAVLAPAAAHACSWARIVRGVQQAGGAGVLVGARPGSDVEEMDCRCTTGKPTGHSRPI
jgi:hypothetical protein